MVFGFLVGVVFSVLALMYATWKANKRDGILLIVKHPKKEQWDIYGNYAKVSAEVADVRAQRKPGVIKYVD